MALNPFLSRSEKKERQSKGYWAAPRQEKKLAKRLGGQTITGSGSKLRKGDVEVRGIVRIEAKTTSADSFRVSKEMLQKIRNASLPSDQVPAIIIEFLNAKGLPEGEVAVIPVDMLETLIHGAKTNSKAGP